MLKRILQTYQPETKDNTVHSIKGSYDSDLDDSDLVMNFCDKYHTEQTKEVGQASTPLHEKITMMKSIVL
jgi:hypothetical protein